MYPVQQRVNDLKWLKKVLFHVQVAVGSLKQAVRLQKH